MTGQDADTSIEAIARDWYARRLGGLSDREAMALRAWLDAAPAHRRAFAAVDALWADLAWDETLNAEALDRQSNRTARRERFRLPKLRRAVVWSGAGVALLATSLALAVLIVLPFAAPQTSGPAGQTVVFETAVGEIREVELADGSRVTLGGRTAIRVDIGRFERQVSLVTSGDALFDVARDETRPFTVRAGTLSARVHGTVFEVNRSPGVTAVSVVEGEVRVTETEGGSVVLGAGDRVVAEAGETWEHSRFDVSQAARWIETRLAYSDAPLSDIVDDINRYHSGGLVLASPELAELRVTSSFRIDQMETALSGIAMSHGLDLVATPDGGYRLQRSDAPE